MKEYHSTLEDLVDGDKNLYTSATNLIASEAALKESNELLKESIIEAANLNNDKYNNIFLQPFWDLFVLGRKWNFMEVFNR